MDVKLRQVQQGDLPLFYEQQLDPDANYMAAFTSEDPSNREAFDAHWDRILNKPDITLRAVEYDGEVAGYVAKFDRFDKPEISYWLGREFWGKGIATNAVSQMLAVVTIRPIYARVAHDNVSSLRVLTKCGFIIDEKDHFFANARGKEIDELILKLE